MNFKAAKERLKAGAVMRRESWAEGMTVEAEVKDPDVALKLIRQDGREYGVAYVDMTGTDWVIVNEGRAE